MFHYLRKYPLSLFLVVLIVYLSLFRPPEIDKSLLFPGYDKCVHIGMYAVLSGFLWLEFLLKHKTDFALRRVLVGAVFFPGLLGGIIELLQEFFTTYRGGEWMDLLADVIGVILAGLIGYYVLRPRIIL